MSSLVNDVRAQRCELVRTLPAVRSSDIEAVQDAIVAEGLLREYAMMAHLDGENGFTYGLLYGRQRPAGRWCVPDLPRARRRVGRRRLRRWLD
jgi:hypothetical protein